MKFSFGLFLILPSLVLSFRIQSNTGVPEPPPHEEIAKMSRWLTHYNDYTALATISIRDGIKGYPYTATTSYADGLIGKSTGIPYFYMTPMDISSQDLAANPKASITLSMAQTGYCSEHDMDPEDPTCARVTLSGEIVQLDENSEEEAVAKEALFARHPNFAWYPADHGFFFAKLQIESIVLLDFFGGAYQVDVAEYFSTTLN